MASSSNKVSMKLLIDTQSEKVLFAEASKTVIDFLFNMLRLPIGTVVRLLTKEDMVGSIGNLYESVENLSDTYLQPNQDKDVLLKPRSLISSTEISGFLPADANNNHDNVVEAKFYMCPSRCTYNVTSDCTTRCPNIYCRKYMNSEAHYVGNKVAGDKVYSTSSSSGGGFVKEVVTYMVMDDLVIQPMSTISSITILNKFNIKEVGALQEKVVELEMAEGIDLLKASLESNTVLTNVFLKNKKRLKESPKVTSVKSKKRRSTSTLLSLKKKKKKK